MKTGGKCHYCKDPIYDFQKVTDKQGDKYHEGCAEIEEQEKK